MSPQFHDCSEHAECFNLRATYTCSCREGYADLSVNPLYPGRVCSGTCGESEKKLELLIVITFTQYD